MEETVRTLKEIVQDKTILNTLSANLLKTVNKHFSMEAVKGDYEELFSKWQIPPALG